MAEIVAVANQKGGVAKTTTVQALSMALAVRGHRVLAIDLDPQACLTYSFGWNPDALDSSLYDVLLARAKMCEVTRAVSSVGELWLAPSNIELAGAEAQLLSRTGREHTVRKALQPVLGDYDFVVVDCPPSLGILTINGLTAARHLLIPMQCEMLSQRGVSQLLTTVDEVREFSNPDLEVLGVVATMFDRRTRHARQVLDDVRNRFGLPVLAPPVPKSVRFAEAPELGRSILQHAPDSPGAIAYHELAAEVEKMLAKP